MEASDAQRQELQEHMRSGERDQHGVRDCGVIVDQEANRTYCLLDAPNEEAVRAHHEDADVPLQEVHRADAMMP